VSAAVVLDTGALIAIERRSAKVQALVTGIRSRQAPIVVPTAVVAQAVRQGSRQAGLRRFLSDSCLRFASLDYQAALEIAALLGWAGAADVVDAAVVVCAQRLGGCPIITSDPGDLRALDPAAPLIAV
jgi:predicted nucleic acid-binding protein